MIELLVTIVVMGIAFAVIVGGLGISIVGSDTSRRQATAETVLLNFAERVRSATYQPDCDLARGEYETAFPTVTGFTRQVVSVSPANSANATQFQPCTGSNTPPDNGLQLVVISVTSEERPVTRTVQVVKRDP